MKKVLLIMPISTLDFGSKSVGGVDSVCQMLLKDLIDSEQKDFRIRILAFDPTSSVSPQTNKTMISRNVDLVRMPINERIKGVKVPGIVSNFLRIRKEVKRFDPDIVHAHISSWLIGAGRKKTVATLHNYKNIGRKSVSFFNDMLYAQILPRLSLYYIDHYTCVGHLLETTVKKEVSKPISVIGNPINTQFFEIKRNETSTAHTRFITCALLNRKKRIEQSINLVVLMHKTNRKVELIIVGPNVDEEYWQELNQLIVNENATDYIRFVGHKNTEELVELYKSANMGIFLSSEETFGLAPLEMLASGLPVISSNVGIIEERPEYFKSIGTCIIDPENKDDAFSKSIEFISQQTVVNREALQQQFSVRAVNKQYFSVYKKLFNA
ncbi:VpsD family glycosyltransferase [Vibrio alfacsensis]|uniref:VpsD family glycosyltransferase n=1 Tax=Vibrio alfacsensis TaxID=1074311 RepID=UPI004067E059